MQKKEQQYESDGSESEESENSNEKEQMDTDEDENVSENEEQAGPSGLEAENASEKKKKRGIIYLSSIPKYMNVTILREMLSEYAKIGRIYLEPGKLTRKPIFCFKFHCD